MLPFSFKMKEDTGMMVTCSKDRSIAVWDMVSPTEINLRYDDGRISFIFIYFLFLCFFEMSNEERKKIMNLSSLKED